MTFLSNSNDARVGQVIGKRFSIVRLLGSGGMGSVYYVEDTIQKGKAYAVKFLAENLIVGNLAQRFSQEAKIGAQLGKKSRHIAQVMACGMHGEKIPYYVMEYLEGESLKDILKSQPLSLPRFFGICRQICLGLQAAHDGIEIDGKICPVIHRDIKPANILVTIDFDGNELVKILDFGIAKLAGEVAKLTRTCAFLGTLAYCSPEQMEGRELDNRSDIYSLGVVMFEMLTGQSPWGEAATTKSYGDWYRIHHSQKPYDFNTHTPGLKIPAELKELVMRCLAKERDARPSNVAEILKAMSAIALFSSQSIEKSFVNPPQWMPTGTPGRKSGKKIAPVAMSFEIKEGLFKLELADPHAVLGLPIGTHPTIVHKRYLEIAYILHPDTCTAESQEEKDIACAMFARLVYPAYVQLCKQTCRTEYFSQLQEISKQLALVGSRIPINNQIAQQLTQASGNLNQAYSASVQKLASKQYECLDRVVESFAKRALSAIALLSELNLVYLIQKEKQKEINITRSPEKTSGNTNVPITEEKKTANVSPSEGYIRRAVAYMANDNFSKAIVELRDALILEPANSNCHSLLGLAYLKQQQPTMAKVHINKALELNPKDPKALQGKQMLDKLAQKTSSDRTTISHDTIIIQSNPSDPTSGGLFNGFFGGKKKGSVAKN